MNYSISEIELGHNDGKTEANYIINFENYFFNYENIVKRALKPTTYMILGRKGTGKSLLGEYLAKVESSDRKIVSIVSFRDLKVTELEKYKSDETAPNEYIAIWYWILLVEIAKVILEFNEYVNEDEYSKLEKFLNENGYNEGQQAGVFNLDMRRFENVNADVLRVPSSTLSSSSKGHYSLFINDLLEIITNLITKMSDKEALLILDDLDDRFINNHSYKNNLISIVKATDKLNMFFRSKNVDIKILLLLRTDIFALLNDTDLNKIRADKTIAINWGHDSKINFDTPLFHLVFSRAKQSIPILKTQSTYSLTKTLFPYNPRHRAADDYLLLRTFFRPRDLLIFLKFAQKNSPKAHAFESHLLYQSEKDYSEYLFDEVRNELKGHIDDDIINEITSMLKRFSYPQFTFKEIQNFESSRKNLKNITLPDALELLFNFSVIGNLTTGGYNNRNIWTWKYRDERANIDFNQKFAIHLGLKKHILQY